MKTLRIEAEGGMVRVVLARPDVLNAFDETMIAELTETYLRLGQDGNIRAIVLQSDGRVFCAGADLAWMQRARENADQENLADAQRFSEMMRTLYECPKPTLARVQGAAYGGGVGLICACDIAVAADSAKFAVTEARVGILPSAIAPYLINAVGLRQARRLALTTEIIDANCAHEIGLLHQVVQSEKLDEAIDNIIDNLRRGGPGALAEIKTLFRTLGVGQIDPETRKLTAETIARVRGREEAREGFAAFFEKRPPSWMTSHD